MISDRTGKTPSAGRLRDLGTGRTTPDAFAPSGSDHRLAARLALALLALILAAGVLATRPARALASCANPVACENQQQGDPPADWQVDGAGDPSIQGFATQFSVNAGQTVYFKINTPSKSYHIDILRLGYYGGDGARKIASHLVPTATLPQTQPSCITDSSTGLIDCGKWSVSASWTVPSNAVSGVYVAHLVRDDPSDPGGDSQIPFVVRNDGSHSDVVLTTNDATWEAYNNYGGNSLYDCTVACPPGNPLAYKAAYAVSYNRPFDGSFAVDGGASYLYYAEYQTIYWLEQNGYDVSYVSDVDIDHSDSVLLNHKLLITSGHDEYWSGSERANVQAAINAGVNAAFFTGNEVFWKTRYANSEDGSNTPSRTLITYKETHFNGPVDPADPPTWTGAWADPRFSPPGDGGVPGNSLTGQMFVVNSGTSDLSVPYQYSKLRMWRNTAVAQLTSGHSLTLSPNTGTLGYEWDVDADNGFRPAGEFDLSSTTVSGVQPFIDYGSTTASSGTVTHHLTLYRASGGALVFGAGTVQWSWGLSNVNAWSSGSTDPSANPPDPTMEQATVNLFADMGAQPTTLISGLTPATQSTDTTPPTSTISSPSAGANLQDGAQVTISGSATDAGGGVVAGVEVSTDGGSTWHPATSAVPDQQTVSWTYTWLAHGNPSTTIETRAVDDSGNLETPSDGTSVNVSCPCSLWGPSVEPAKAVPGDPGSLDDSGDSSSIEVGVKFTSDTFGQVTGIKFYKAAANTGTHVGSLWTSDGQLLASATFTNETASGWQTVTFSNPVTILPGTIYVAGYFAPNGHYSATGSYFYPSPAPTPEGGATLNSRPLHAVPNATSANGLYSYTPGSAFPTNSYQAANYWVDVAFAPLPAPGQVTGVSATAGQGSATVTWHAPSSGGPATTYTVTPYENGSAQQVTTVTGNPAGTSVTIHDLTPGTPYTFTVQASNPTGAGQVSAASSPVTPTALTPPSAPAGVTASGASSQAMVTWSAPTSDGGKPITGYTVTPYIGSTAQTSVQVSGASTTTTTITGLTNGTAYTFAVAAVNSVGTGSASSSNSATPYNTIFDFATPAMPDAGDGNSVELGVKFTATLDGSITGIRFYKSAANSGAHSVHLWTVSGQLLASGASSNETASGWQTVLFSSPAQITSGTTYVASYYAPNGHYSDTPSGLSSAVSNGPLQAVGNGTSPDGVYAYGGGGTFPSGAYNASNYGVDVLFIPTPPPGQATNVSATPGKVSATVTWSAPATGGTATKYTITPYIGGAAQTSTVVTGNPAPTTATITGLTAGTAYTFTVQAANGNGSGSVSAPSSPVTPTAATAPVSPTGVSAIPASGQAQVSWTAPQDNGGSAITSYKVIPYIGSTAQTPVQVGGSATSATVTGLTDGTAYTFTVSATNSVGTGAASAPSSAITPEDTIFDFATPATFDSGDGSAVTLGVAFRASEAGQVAGVRFYKAQANTGTHIGSLWSANGTLLASATFTNESASGWQQVTFQNPVAIVPGTTYVASYYTPSGHYSVASGGLSSAVNNPPVQALANSTTPNGLYAYGSGNGFPRSTFGATNYYVDVMFQPVEATAPAAPQNVSATPATGSAQVNWSAPSSDGGSPITGFTVTPYVGSSAQTPVQVSGASTTSTTITGLTNGTAYTFQVTAQNGVGTSSTATSGSVTPEETIFDFATPATLDSGDTAGVTLGVKFTATTAGSVTGIRFYKAPANTGTHVGALWDTSGNLLAQAPFTTETGSGWQAVTFNQPVSISAGTTYIASYFAPNGHYSTTSNGFGSMFANPPLDALASSTSANGVFTYGNASAFPTSSWNSTNYWVDVLFRGS